MEISYLADHPEFIDTLAQWIYSHWRPILVGETVEDRRAKLRTHLNTDVLPIAFVAHSGADVFGIAALRQHDLPGREDLTPWLGGVFVGQPFRRKGIGTELCAAVEEKAKSLFTGTPLYLFTLDKQDWYHNMGWSFLETCNWCGKEGIIMSRTLA